MSNTIEGIRKSIEEIISETDEAQLLLYTVEEDMQMLQKDNAKLTVENLQLRQQMDKLIRILNNHYDLCIQWDGLRKFWYVGLTDEGVRERDERDAENAKLRACLGDGCADCAVGMGRYADSLCDPIKAENEKLRELILGMLVDEERGHNNDDTYYEHVRLAKGLGIEVG